MLPILACAKAPDDSEVSPDSGSDCHIPQVPDACDTAYLYWGQFEGIPEVIDFGDVVVNESATEEFTVVNVGDGFAYILSWWLSQPEAPFQLSRNGVDAPPGWEGEFSVTFSPSSQGTYDVRMSLDVDEHEVSIRNIQLLGNAIQP